MIAEFMSTEVAAYLCTLLMACGAGMLTLTRGAASWSGLILITVAFVLIAGGPFAGALWCGPAYAVIVGLFAWVGRSHRRPRTPPTSAESAHR